MNIKHSSWKQSNKHLFKFHPTKAYSNWCTSASYIIYSFFKLVGNAAA